MNAAIANDSARSRPRERTASLVSNSCPTLAAYPKHFDANGIVMVFVAQ